MCGFDARRHGLAANMVVVPGWWLDLVIVEVFSSLNDSVTPVLVTGPRAAGVVSIPSIKPHPHPSHQHLSLQSNPTLHVPAPDAPDDTDAFTSWWNLFPGTDYPSLAWSAQNSGEISRGTWVSKDKGEPLVWFPSLPSCSTELCRALVQLPPSSLQAKVWPHPNPDPKPVCCFITSKGPTTLSLFGWHHKSEPWIKHLNISAMTSSNCITPELCMWWAPHRATHTPFSQGLDSDPMGKVFHFLLNRTESIFR